MTVLSIKHTDIDIKNGLSDARALFLQKTHGLNQIEKKAQASGLKILLSQFSSPLIFILLLASGVTFLLGDLVDTYIILTAVVLNTVLGFYQEYRAQRDLEALASVLSPRARVLRNGVFSSIPSEQLVPGDVVSLESGESIGADGVLVEARGLLVNEGVLTGESVAVTKNALDALGEVSQAFCSLHERDGKKGQESVYMGTTILSGSGLMVVVFTGGKTEVGSIAHQLYQTIDEETPLQLRLKKLGTFLTSVVLLIAVIIFAMGIVKGISFKEIFSLSVAVAVSAIPEGLAVSLTAILAIGMQRILKRKALVRKLLAAEVLGSVSVICCDKTGTLTEGQMRVVEYEAIDREKLLTACVVGNSMYDPIDLGMWEWAKKTIEKDGFEGKSISFARFVEKHELLDHLPFDPEHRYAAKLSDQGAFIVGAPEVLLSFSTLSHKKKVEWDKKMRVLAQMGLRVVGFGYKEKKSISRLTRENIRHSMTFLGLLAYEDPIRSGVSQALADARKAGVDVKVITGDFRETARGVMRKLDWEVADDEIIEGSELEALSESELKRRVARVVLFARTTPGQKLKIVSALQARGEVVAMTGDGVNDAPALKKSDIGVVVSTASDVSKETADLVLLDNNFATIVAAIEEGRGIFDNLKKIILYLLGNAFSETLIVVAALFLGMPLPVTSAQILWINLVDDGLPNLALTVDPKKPGLLKQKPRRRIDPIIDQFMSRMIVVASLTTSIVVFVVYWWYLKTHTYQYAQTMAFTTLAVSTLFYVLSSRGVDRPIWSESIWKNKYLILAILFGVLMQVVAVYLPFLQGVFRTHSLDTYDWLVVFASSAFVVIVVELSKYLFLSSRKPARIFQI